MQARRGDEFEAWLKEKRDVYSEARDRDEYSRAIWYALDDLLDDYRLHADTGVPLESKEPMQ